MRNLTTIVVYGIATVAFAVASVAAPSSHSVSGSTKKSGTYITPSHTTNSNNTKPNYWSTKGNVNPYTGKPGTKVPTIAPK
jgi:hypothetical protein